MDWNQQWNGGCFDRIENSFKRFRIWPPNSKAGLINKIYEHSNGLLLTGTSKGLYVPNRISGQFKRYKFEDIDESIANTIQSISEDAMGNLLVGTHYIAGGLIYLDLPNEKSYHFISSSNIIDHKSPLSVLSLAIHEKNRTLIGTSSGLCQFNSETFYEAIEKGDYNVTEVAYMVGFSSQSYFTKSFQKHFGKSPSEFQT